MTRNSYAGDARRSDHARWIWAGAATALSLLGSSAIAQEVAEGAHLNSRLANANEQVTPSRPEDGTEVSSEQDDGFADLSLEELMEVQVVVTAARREQKITTVPYAISVITAADIRAAGARSVPDALRLVPGVDVADLSFSNSAVSPRGFHGFIAAGVLVLVDGRQIFDSLFGGTLWGAWPFLLEDIDRIEVIRGPGGVTWGANAMNGVINIITKDPADQLGLTVSSRGASRGSFKEYIGYGTREGNLRLRVSAEYEASDGFLEGGSFLRALDDSYKGGRLSLYAVYDKDEDNRFTFSGGSAIVDGGSPPTPLAGFGIERNGGTQASFLLGRWSHRIAPKDWIELIAFINDAQASPGIPQIDYRYQQIGLQFSHAWQPDEGHTRTWGIDTRVDLLDGGNAAPHMLSRNQVYTAILGAYLQDEWQFAPRWTLNLGGRIDYEFYAGFQPSARASLSYELSDDAVVYGAVSRAFGLPTAAGRFLHIPLLNGLVHVTSGLADPTTLIAYEVGYRSRLSDRFDASVSLFWHEYDEVTTLSPRIDLPGVFHITFDNRGGNVSLYGVEMDAKYRVSEKLTLVGNYTYQQLNWDVTEPFTDRDYITPPKQKLMCGARYTVTDDLRLSAHGYYVDAVKSPNPANPLVVRRIDPYFRLDLRAEHEFWNDRASFAVGVSNLLDSSHYEGGTLFLNDAEVPRMIFAEFRLRIK